MMVPKSLKNLLLLVVAVLVVATGITVSQLVAHRYSVSLLDAAAARAENMAHKLSLEAVDKILINDRVALQKMLDDQIASDASAAYLFVVRDGHLLAHTFTDGVPVQLIGANPIENGSNGRIAKIISQDGHRFIDAAYPIFDGKAGTLRMGLSEEPYRRQVHQLWVRMSAITLGILTLALLVGHRMISRLLRPLQALTQCAEQIDAGNLSMPVHIGGGGLEVTKLAAAFNAMLTRLQDHTERLEEYNLRLEQTNLELDRTHNQLKTSFSISQQIASLPGLDQICQFLIHALRQIVTCRNLNLLVFNHAARSITLATPSETLHLDYQVYDKLSEQFGVYRRMTLLGPTDIGGLQLPEPLDRLERVALFPIHHHDLMVGALMVACHDNCDCIEHEMDIVSMILHQASGAIHRAELHEEELRKLRGRIDMDAGLNDIIGRDPKMQVVFKLIEDVAPTDATVLIQGESGTGKELVARALHERSTRSQKPFVVINCSAYPSTLLESELFGHEKGAFTGALRRKTGRFEQADGGTVFLDEIGEIEPSAQVKLLRVLQQQTIDRLGGQSPIKVDVRILAATNKKLLEEVRNGTFREDLFYRLNVIPIHLPPLRKRRQDIHILVRHFLERFAKEQGKRIIGVRSEAMRALLDSPWPGNVRELENSIEHAVVLTKGDHIELKDLPSALISAPATIPTGRGKMAESEIRIIRDVLDACDWNKTIGARQLGISRSTLYEKLKRLRIRRDSGSRSRARHISTERYD
jgi:DNA-binding NtrC family response regulator/HAMP domain-containing protein